jgi:hypothetical protein
MGLGKTMYRLSAYPVFEQGAEILLQGKLPRGNTKKFQFYFYLKPKMGRDVIYLIQRNLASEVH